LETVRFLSAPSTMPTVLGPESKEEKPSNILLCLLSYSSILNRYRK
jgi:hypothetical protein